MMFTSRFIGESADATEGALLLLGESIEEVDKFFVAFTDAMFPPAERASSSFVVQTRPHGFLLYEVRSQGRVVSILLENVTLQFADYVRRTITKYGSILLLFGAESDDGVVLLRPSENHLLRTSVVIDGNWLDGRGGNSWSDFIAMADESFATVGELDE